MQSIKQWEDKMQEKRKKTPWREFLKELSSWLNLSFYKNNGLISKYPPSSRINICSVEEYQNSLDSFSEGKNYNFGKDFFSNFEILFKNIKHSALNQKGNNENASFTDTALNVKNSYLSNTVTIGSENVFYSVLARINVKNVFNSVFVVNNSEEVYSSKGINISTKIFYSSYIKNSYDIWFSSNLTGCSHCIFCNNGENLSYCINNKQYNEKDFYIKKEEILKDKGKFGEFHNTLSVLGNNNNSFHVNGNFILESENIVNGNFVFNVKNGKNLMYVGSTSGGENWFDFLFGGENSNNIYGVSSAGLNCSHIYMSRHISVSSNIYYSHNIDNCSFCLGCIGLKNKSFCILNKQYTKEEWYEMADKIFATMEKDGILGDFFPGSLNPFYFNDTMAYLIDDSFTKEEVEKDGFMWRDEKIKVDIPEGAEIVYASEKVNKLCHPELVSGSLKGRSPNYDSEINSEGQRNNSVSNNKGQKLDDYQGFDENGKWFINPEILKKVIIDEQGNYYRIVEMEYDFLIKYELPLPEIHWLERIKLGFKF